MKKQNLNNIKLFFEMLELNYISFSCEQKYKGFIFENDILIGYAKEEEKNLECILYNSEYSRVNISLNQTDYFEADVDIMDSVNIKYKYYEDLGLYELITKKDNKLITFEMSENSIIITSNDSVNYVDVKDTKEENIKHIQKIAPKLYNNIIEDIAINDPIEFDLYNEQKIKQL